MTSDFYTPLREALPPLELDVVTPNRMTGGKHRVHWTCEHVLYKRYIGLGDLTIGEVGTVADPSGSREMKLRRIKLKAVTHRLSNLNPAIYPGGEITDTKEVEKWIDADENSDAVFMAWDVFTFTIDNPPQKSTAQGDSDGGREDEGEPLEARPVAQLSAV